MKLKPSENTKLYGMDHFFNEITNLFNEKKMPNKILLTGKKGLGKSTMAYHIVNYILSKNEDCSYDTKNFTINDKNRSFRLIQNNSHPNFYCVNSIQEKKSIDIDQVRKMISYTNMSSFNNIYKFILIDNIEFLNKNSVNALLKIIEEPNDNVFFILIHNYHKNILPTLKSRCLSFRINLSYNETIDILNKILNKNVLEIVNNDLLNYYNSPGEIISLINFSDEEGIDIKNCNLNILLNLLIDNKYYKNNKIIKMILINLIEAFFLREYKFSINKESILNFYHDFINKIRNSEKFNLDEESLFLEFKSKLLNG